MKKSNFRLLALVMEKYDDQKQLKVQFIHPAGFSPSFSFPHRLDELVISHAQVKMKTSPITSTGRVYNIPSADGLQATLLLNDLGQFTRKLHHSYIIKML